MVASVIRRQYFLKDFISETTGPISLKFHMQPSGKWGKKVNIFRPVHVTKMTSILINIKKTKKIFSRTTGPIASKLGM